MELFETVGRTLKIQKSESYIKDGKRVTLYNSKEVNDATREQFIELFYEDVLKLAEEDPEGMKYTFTNNFKPGKRFREIFKQLPQLGEGERYIIQPSTIIILSVESENDEEIRISVDFMSDWLACILNQ